MNMNDLILKKRSGEVLSKEEIEEFITGYTKGEIPDYQAAALLMAIWFKKLNKEETYNLTRAMKYSGDVVDLSEIKGIKVDKHSTGGVGDKTTLIIGPIAAALGVPIAKMSGRGLGFTGGTVDKMESIPGFKTELDAKEFLNQVNDIGISVIGQTAHVAPADKKLYALRDVTATIDNVSLITASIMSKKLASGSDAVVLDVKCGKGAFMETEEAAEELGTMMVEIGKADGKKMAAVITDMNQPLGRAVGNSLEIIEVIETLKGNGPADLTELSVTLAGIMLYLGEKAETIEQGIEMAKGAISDGSALKKLGEFIERQGGNKNVIKDYSLFPSHSISLEVKADKTGYITDIDARRIGLASQHSGAGRATKEDVIDLSCGIYLNKKRGEYVEAGEILATIYGNNLEKLETARNEAFLAYNIGTEEVLPLKLVKKIIGL